MLIWNSCFTSFRPETSLGMNQITSSIDFADLLEMLGGDEQIVTSLLSKFVEELTSDHAAGEQVMVDYDAEALRQIAHRIRGTSAS